MSNCVEGFGEITEVAGNPLQLVHGGSQYSFKNFINKEYQLCLIGKPWPESMLIILYLFKCLK